MLDDNLYIFASPFLRELIHGFQAASKSLHFQEVSVTLSDNLIVE